MSSPPDSPEFPSSSSQIPPSSPVRDVGNARRQRRPVVQDDGSDAIESEALHQNDQGSESEEDGEELINENMVEDYRPIAELDRYDSDDLTDEEIDDDIEARLAAEREMRRRDRINARRGELPSALAALDREDEQEGLPRRRRRTRLDNESVVQLYNEDDSQPYVNLDEFSMTDPTLFNLENVKLEIRRRFRVFVREFNSNDNTIDAPYIKKINTMCEENDQSIEINYNDLASHVPILSFLLVEYPEQTLELLNQEIASIASTLYVNYHLLHQNINIRICDFPMTSSVRDLRQSNLNHLVRVSGIAVRRTAVYPQLKICYYKCNRCGERVGPLYMNNDDVKPSRCLGCQTSNSFDLDMSETIFQNYQKITLQETPGSVPAGRIPRQKDIIVLQDLIDACTPGEEIDVTGVYKHSFDQTLNRQNGFPVFSTVIIANNLRRREMNSDSSFAPSDADIRDIINLSKMPNIAELIYNSIAPDIYGHKHIKIAIALSLFGGEAKEFENKHRLRGDINVLLLGDPGTAKSQFLKSVEKLSPRSVYTTGKGASAVGLTASVRNDPLTREWTLEGGALVLADQGVCLIDEFDKMSDQDRTSIHEAMEQQTISVSKAGIVCTLKSRCSVIAAANPISGRYNNALSFQEQVDLTDPILSRFDCFCIVRDLHDPTLDANLARFVTSSHMKSHPAELFAQQQTESVLYSTPEQRQKELFDALNDPERPHIPQNLFRKYLAYAKKTCHPRLQNVDDTMIIDLYADLRKKAPSSGGIQITSRQIESLIRMAEAHAKMHLREFVNKNDVDAAISTMLESFLSSQKLSARLVLEPQLLKYRHNDEQRYSLLLDKLRQDIDNTIRFRQLLYRVDYNIARSTPVEIPLKKFADWASSIRVIDLAAFFLSPEFKKQGYKVNAAKGIIEYISPDASSISSSDLPSNSSELINTPEIIN